MKDVFVFVFLALFFANTAIASAWVQPCMDGALPCHQMNDPQAPDGQHCEGLCLCAYLSNTPPLFAKIGDEIRLPLFTTALFTIDSDTLVSLNQTPPSPPPKSIS